MNLNMPLPTPIMLEDVEVFCALVEEQLNAAFIEWFDSEIDKEISGQPLVSGREPRGLIGL